MVTKECGQLSHVFFDFPNIGPRPKLRGGVFDSLMTYGCESWTLTEKVKRRINGVNSQMLSHITGNSVQVEARRATTRHDIIKHIKTIDNGVELCVEVQSVGSFISCPRTED